MAAIALMLLASARPTAVVSVPLQQETIMLAMDVSGSMRATDVLPNRLVASQNAAKALLADLPRHVRVGIDAFAGTAAVVQPPNLSREELLAAIDKFPLERGTAIGNGIVLSLSELFPDAGINLNALPSGRDRLRGTSINQALNDAKDGKKKEPFVPVEPGSYTSAAIILLTDGQRTTGVDSLEPAKLAADRSVRIDTVGVGRVDGETIGFEGWSMRVKLDEDTLKNIAKNTQAEYVDAGSAADLKKVYKTLSARLAVVRKETEI